MRYLRNTLLLTVSALALSGLTASAASAAVDVANGGERVLQGEMKFVNPNGAAIECDVDMTLVIESSGEVDVSSVDGVGGASYGCNPTSGPGYLDDCGDAGWGGQIVGPGDAGYLGTADFEMVLDTCFHAFTQVFGSYGTAPLRFGLDQNHQSETMDWSLKSQTHTIYGVPFTATGTGYDGSDPYSLWVTSVE